ncbi:MAG: phosphonopyruvate decarboxylase [Gammaproteobacteria bacterium]
MIEAHEFVDAARERGFDWYAGVPCSFLTPFINYVISDDNLNYISAANEGDAVALATGAALGGKRSVAMMQNSGLGNAVSPLTSLSHTFRIPILVICTHRGAPGVSDEPQHELMGQITEQMFATMRVPATSFPGEATAIPTALDAVEESFQGNARPHALIMRKGTCAPFELKPQAHTGHRDQAIVSGSGHSLDHEGRASRNAVLERLVANSDPARDVIIATTGFTGRELYALNDRPNHLYMVGSMGCASSLALGLALARPDLRIVVVDGDGAGLMRLGNLATVGHYNPANLVHLLLDNEVHDSTGGQGTVTASTDFAGIAAACGYGTVTRSDRLEDISNALNATARKSAGTHFVHFKTAPGTIDPLPRPTIAPADVARRLMHHIGTNT